MTWSTHECTTNFGKVYRRWQWHYDTTKVTCLTRVRHGQSHAMEMCTQCQLRARRVHAHTRIPYMTYILSKFYEDFVLDHTKWSSGLYMEWINLRKPNLAKISKLNILSWSRVVSEMCPTSISNTHVMDMCIFKNLLCVRISCPCQSGRVSAT